ncbi:mechanosensitive ion channel family protein [Metabacillus arenae]|uniref:Mechanosensitive ion channel family protein n=1 Tax=Metabacillus arenae TaxID=2771434 RepID=A0A926S030_9BACI|nr:mechanosensitive ion channel family protein [Metabacillus arenae]MBD1379624.1 mechanosensitive ion channel family protein [Metabacillus arenae]
MEQIREVLGIEAVKIAVVALFLWISVILINKLIDHFFERTDFIEERKEKTIASIIRSLTKYVASIGFILYVISIFVEDFGRILAGAGIAGIVIGFGAQSLIRDILAGMFLIYERQVHQGDFVTINNLFHGTVEELGLRSLKIREWSGKLLTISNGEVKQIHNYNIEQMRVIEKIVVSYRENPDTIFETLEKACLKLNAELAVYLKMDFYQKPIEPFQVYGITSLNALNRGIEYTITGLVNDDDYWVAGRKARKIIAEILYKNNIQLTEDRIHLVNQEKESEQQ